MPPRQREEKEPQDPVNTLIIAAIIFIAAVGILGGVGAALFGNYVDFIQRFYSYNWRFAYILITGIVGVLDTGLLIAVGVIYRKYADVGKGREVGPVKEITTRIAPPQEELAANWQDITALAASDNPSDWNMAVLRADAQLDDMLSHLGYDGETMADRLKIVDPTKLTSLDRVWSAHRLRNAIAHDPLEQHTRETIIHSLKSYEAAFKELKLM